MSSSNSVDIEKIEQQIGYLTAQLESAKEMVRQWNEANKTLSLSAAEARAKNQSVGRGFVGGLLGSKYRGVVRAGAAASNAAIAKKVAEKRAQIVDGKRDAQEQVRQLQCELSVAKKNLKSLQLGEKSNVKVKNAAKKNAHDTLDLLQKLKAAKDAGLITQVEFEEKRKKLVEDL